MDLVILSPFFLLTFFRNKHSLVDYFTGSKFRIVTNNNAAILLMPQLQNYNFRSRRFCSFFAGVPQNEASLCPLAFSVWSNTPSSLFWSKFSYSVVKRVQFADRNWNRKLVDCIFCIYYGKLNVNYTWLLDIIFDCL